jgi:hypothetical protein
MKAGIIPGLFELGGGSRRVFLFVGPSKKPVKQIMGCNNLI